MSNDFERTTSVLWVAESNFASGSGIKSHSHDYYHLFMVREGQSGFSVGEDMFTLGPQEAILAKPGDLHSLNNHTDRLLRCYEVKFSVTAPRLRYLLDRLPPCLPGDTFAAGLVQVLVEESTLAEASSTSFVSNYLTALIDYYYRKYGKKEQPKSSIVDTAGLSDLSCRIVKYLEENSDREVPLQEVADAMGFNKNYICSAFKRDSGMTIGNIMTLIRIHRAAELISFSDMNLMQVAKATGFTNLSHFNRIFKKIVGIPPGQYRRMFTADILVSADDSNDQTVSELLESNGFIVSVLGHKRISISDILQDLQDNAGQSDGEGEDSVKG